MNYQTQEGEAEDSAAQEPENTTYWLPVNNPQSYLAECSREEWEAYEFKVNIIEDAITETDNTSQ